MRPEWWDFVEPEIDQSLKNFGKKLRSKLSGPPENLIKRKNPFLLRVRVERDAEEFARMITDAYLSPSEETMFGNVLEDIAISICHRARGGWKSSADKIDIEYSRNGTRYIVQVKSGTNWGNSSQRAAMVRSFQKAAQILRQGNTGLNVVCIEGVCYGKSGIKDMATHQQYVGHSFWEEISGWNGTAQAILDIVGSHARNGLNDARQIARHNIVEYLVSEGVAKKLEYGDPERVDSRLGHDSTEPQYPMNWDKLLSLVLK